jgi:hypothetical protein
MKEFGPESDKSAIPCKTWSLHVSSLIFLIDQRGS